MKKRGVIKGLAGFGGKMKIDRAMTSVYELRNVGDKPELVEDQSGKRSGGLFLPPAELHGLMSSILLPDGKLVLSFLSRNEVVKSWSILSMWTSPSWSFSRTASSRRRRSS